MFPLVIDDSALDLVDPVAAPVDVAPPMETALVPAAIAAAPVVLRVSGGKPLRMDAVLLVEGETRMARSGIGHALRIYRRSEGDVVVALEGRTGGQAADGTMHRVEAFPDLEEAATWLEAFDPVAELPADLDASDRRLSAVEVALRAAALRIRGDAVLRQYRNLVGDVLYRLDMAG